jgi:DNA modification methylase
MEGRGYLGFELNPNYVDIARSRIDNVVSFPEAIQDNLFTTL